MRNVRGLFAASVLLVAASACSPKPAVQEVVVEIPAGFSGNFLLEMGVKNEPALEKDGDEYFVSVPRNGKVSTSTVLTRPHVTFKNASGASVWGYSDSVFATGDGIPVGGKIEFFVGTKQEYEAQQDHKHQSGGFHEWSQDGAGA